MTKFRPTRAHEDTHMQSYAIETTGLTKRFGKRVVVDNLRLQVPRGSVYAFLGRNGAGKTTTIRLLLDQLRRNAGAATVLGYDSIKGSRDIRQLVGFVAQQEDLYDWMTVDEILWFCRGFYPTWDQTLAAAMQAQLKLDGKTKIRAMSKGTQRQLALLLALAFRPELLILDEPTAGLDVVVRRDFLESVIGLAQEEGRTIFSNIRKVWYSQEVERRTQEQRTNRTGFNDCSRFSARGSYYVISTPPASCTRHRRIARNRARDRV